MMIRLAQKLINRKQKFESFLHFQKIIVIQSKHIYNERSEAIFNFNRTIMVSN